MEKFTAEELELLYKAQCCDIPGDCTPNMAATMLLNGTCKSAEEEDQAWFFVRDYACYY